MRYTRYRQYPVEQRDADEAGASLHGGAAGTEPILAEHLDHDVHNLTGRANDHETDLAAHEERIGQLEAPEHIAIHPPASISAEHLAFNHDWGLYVDNIAINGEAGSRLWLDAPDGGDVVIGPRSGSSSLGEVRLRTTLTTGSSPNVYMNASTYAIARSTSSARYKTDITGHNFDLAAVRALRPVRFRDRHEVETDPEHARWHVGLVAEDVDQAGLDELVTYVDGRPDAVAYDRLPVALLQLVADVEYRLSQRVSELETTVADLRARIIDRDGVVADALHPLPAIPSRTANGR